MSSTGIFNGVLKSKSKLGAILGLIGGGGIGYAASEDKNKGVGTAIGGVMGAATGAVGGLAVAAAMSKSGGRNAKHWNVNASHEYGPPAPVAGSPSTAPEVMRDVTPPTRPDTPKRTSGPGMVPSDVPPRDIVPPIPTPIPSPMPIPSPVNIPLPTPTPAPSPKPKPAPKPKPKPVQKPAPVEVQAPAPVAVANISPAQTASTPTIASSAKMQGGTGRDMIPYEEPPSAGSLSPWTNRKQRWGLKGELVDKKVDTGVSYWHSDYVSPVGNKITDVFGGETLSTKINQERSFVPHGQRGYVPHGTSFLDSGPGTVEVDLSSYSLDSKYSLNQIYHNHQKVKDVDMNKARDLINKRMKQYNEENPNIEDTFERKDINRAFYKKVKRRYWGGK